MQQNLRAIISRQDAEDQNIQRRGNVSVLVTQCLKAICVVLLVFIYAQSHYNFIPFTHSVTFDLLL